MIEMRWLVINNPVGEAVKSFHGKHRVLQYRQMIDTTVYAGLNPDRCFPKQWSEWQNVPEVPHD